MSADLARERRSQACRRVGQKVARARRKAQLWAHRPDQYPEDFAGCRPEVGGHLYRNPRPGSSCACGARKFSG